MTYFAFLGLFLAPPLCGLIILAIVDSRAKRMLPVDFQTWRPWRIILLHILVAVLYTTPWDNYLVATQVWWYDPDLVNGMVLGWVPIEEYTFFVLQTTMTGLFVLFLLRYQGHAPRALSRQGWGQATRFRWASTGLVLLIWTISVVVLFAGSRGPNTYLVLILSWALPPILLQLGFGGDILWRHRGVVFFAIAATTLYLCIGDSAAIAAGTWTISPQLTTGIAVGNLPLEEILFFLVTNILVVFGVILMLSRRSVERAPTGVINALRPFLGSFLGRQVQVGTEPPRGAGAGAGAAQPLESGTAATANNLLEDSPPVAKEPTAEQTTQRGHMLSDFQRKKLMHLFNLYDINHDGELGRIDFELAATALCNAFGLSPESTEAAAVQRGYTEYWSYLQRYMDRNLDKSISVIEFVNRYEFLSRQPESVETLVISTAEYLVQLTDLDGDNVINRKEYVAYLGAHHIPPNNANAAFDLIDANISNTLTKDEILNGVRVFLTSDDEVLPGNCLFGLL